MGRGELQRSLNHPIQFSWFTCSPAVHVVGAKSTSAAPGTPVPAIARLVAADEDTVRDVIHALAAAVSDEEGMAMLHDSEDTEEIIERVAALDIGKAELVACIRVPSPNRPGRRAQEITTYSTMTRSLLRLADRLVELGVRVVMEGTSDYWKPVVRHEAL